MSAQVVERRREAARERTVVGIVEGDDRRARRRDAGVAGRRDARVRTGEETHARVRVGEQCRRVVEAPVAGGVRGSLAHWIAPGRVGAE